MNASPTKPIHFVRDEARRCRSGEITTHEFLTYVADRLIVELRELGWSDEMIINYSGADKFIGLEEALHAELPTHAIARSANWSEALRIAGLKPTSLKNSVTEFGYKFDQLAPYVLKHGEKIKRDIEERNREVTLQKERTKFDAVSQQSGPRNVGPANLKDILGS